MTRHLLFGFHAVGIRLKTAPRSVVELHVDAGRRDQRMRQLLARAEAAGVKLVESDDARLRVADGAGAHAVIAPKDHAVGVNATVAKVASGAAETVPFFMVTNLARTLGELKERDR